MYSKTDKVYENNNQELKSICSSSSQNEIISDSISSQSDIYQVL